MIRRPPRSTQSRSSAASDVYKRQASAPRRPLSSSGSSAVARHPCEGLTPPTGYRSRTTSARSPHVLVASRRGAVVEVNHAAAEAAYVQQLKLHVGVAGQGLLAASDHDGRDEQVALVDQPGLERLGGEVGTAHAHVCLLYTSPSPRD